MNLCRALLFFTALFSAAAVRAQGIVWTGATTTFSNAPFSDSTQPANQDHLTPQVWLTRSGSGRNTRGIFNAAFESSYAQFTSPAGTEWALGSLANHAALIYTDWATAYGGPGALANNITSTNSVLHLINEDIYLSVRFTVFGSTGGGFVYERSTPVPAPEPGVNVILLSGTFLLLLTRRILRG